jgi:hypothetical protein
MNQRTSAWTILWIILSTTVLCYLAYQGIGHVLDIPCNHIGAIC